MNDEYVKSLREQGCPCHFYVERVIRYKTFGGVLRENEYGRLYRDGCPVHDPDPPTLLPFG